MKKINYTVMLSFLLTLLFSTGCKKDTTDPVTNNTTPSYTVPSTYNGFKNVDHTESTTIIGMMTELSAEIAKGTGTGSATIPTPLDITHLKNLLANQGNPFATNASYNTSGFQIESNCIPVSTAQIESFLDTLVAVSNSGMAASPGVAGLGLSKDATPRRFLLTTNGVNYSQMLSKNIMCDLIYYQIANRVSDNTLDNTVLMPGKNYTAMEHNWDVAFGYLGVPDSFPATKTSLKLWGSYSNQVDSGLHCNKIVMDAFLKGRAAISNKDMTTKKAQADIIIAEFDLMMGGVLIQELNEIQVALAASDQVKVVSVISEQRGFVMSMYNNKNPKRTITDAQIATLLNYIPENHWNMTPAQLNDMRAYIAGIYGFTPTQLIIL